MPIILSLLVATGLGAQTVDGSARRAPGVPFRKYLEAARRAGRHAGAPFGKLSRATSASDQAKPFVSGAGLRPAPEWDDQAVLSERFRLLRDARPLFDVERPAFPRRATWLYPDDGCYARAGLVVRTLRELAPEARLPAKIFVFGDLSVATPNAVGGRVEWWYHVAPVVRVGGENFVLDPAIEPARPLSVDEWIARQTPTPASTLVAICGSGTYVPTERCDRASDGIEAAAVADQLELLGAEWARLTELGRSPLAELGNTPPWASKTDLPPEGAVF